MSANTPTDNPSTQPPSHPGTDSTQQWADAPEAQSPVQNEELTLAALQGVTSSPPSVNDLTPGAASPSPSSPPSNPQVQGATAQESSWFARLASAFPTKPAIALPLDVDSDNFSLPSPNDGRVALPEDRDPHILECPHCGRCSRSVSNDSPFKKSCKAYFRPLSKLSNYKPLVHLSLVNFLFALSAWLYIFVCTVLGATLLFALPLGLFVCFLNVLGARVFARWELSIQAYFHGPPPVDSPYRPMPIFFRDRMNKTDAESAPSQASLRVRERSFLKNVHAMITDSTTYQALFYFIVIKPAISLTLLVLFLAATPIAFVLVFPAPYFMKLTKRIGKWQANIAVEGLVGEEWYKSYAQAWQDTVN
ncbi:hypothetical protein ONZ45_g13576 [Pleurotus djamor]|nr:hypothetical protein ONZ45_g13576 [Pleurotus djamor]